MTAKGRESYVVIIDQEDGNSTGFLSLQDGGRG